MNKLLYVLGLSLLLSGCFSTGPGPAASQAPAASASAAPELLTLVDSSRQRTIPVALYRPVVTQKVRGLALFNHGYGGQYTGYSFLTRALAAQGYLVASIQHELPGDAPIASTGNIYQARLPVWQRGVQNMLFVRQMLLRREPALKKAPLLVAGHSNGGDMAMLLAREQPALVEKVISLDNRRMPLPRAARPQVLSLRSSDQQADPGVLPTPEEQTRWGITIVNLPNQLHNDMYDGATDAQKAEMLRHIRAFVE